MRKNIMKFLKRIFCAKNIRCKYALLILALFYLVKNGLNVHFLTKLTITKKETQSFSLDRSIDLQFKLNVESPITFSTHDSSKLNHSRYLNIEDFQFILDGSFANQCKFIPDDLSGKVSVEEHSPLSEPELEFKFSKEFPASLGGHWKPQACQARHQVAIIVPFRDRHHHLRLFLNHMHPFLQKQNIEYRIYIIEEAPQIKFNRALLMNIGYNEAIKDFDWMCFIFHDVDLVPEDDRNLYHCPLYPRHMSIAVNTLGYTLPYKEIFGGVSAIHRKHFEMINGFSNSYYGWGGEDDDFSDRILLNGLKITRYPENIARYYMLGHDKDIPSKQRYKLLKSSKNRFKTDGINSLKYNLIKKEYRRLYTWMLVSFEEPKISN